MTTLHLTPRQAALIDALITHHIEELAHGFIEGTATWTAQLTIDPQLATDVVGTVQRWIADAKVITRQIHQQQLQTTNEGVPTQ
jgi:hypothetical protein